MVKHHVSVVACWEKRVGVFVVAGTHRRQNKNVGLKGPSASNVKVLVILVTYVQICLMQTPALLMKINRLPSIFSIF